jgi:RNA recognition motif-containing protein
MSFKASERDTVTSLFSTSEDETIAREYPRTRVGKMIEQSTKDESEYTTVLVRNIPSKYTLDWLLEEVRVVADCDFVHLPTARRSGSSNFGYAFVNFVTPEDARKFLQEFDGHHFVRQPRSSKRACVKFAELQGFSENVALWNAPKILAKMSERGNAPWIKN